MNPAAADFAQHMSEIQAELRFELQHAQELHAKNANCHRLPTPDLQVGNKVWLLRKNIKTTRPSSKLDFKRLGPFKIEAQINPVAFKLQLPSSFKIHPVFHVSLLEPYHADPSSDRQQPPPPPVEIEGEPEFEVAEILDSKIQRNRLFYLVDWLGYDISERSWQPAANLKNSPELLAEFHDKYPDKPNPSMLNRAPSRRRR